MISEKLSQSTVFWWLEAGIDVVPYPSNLRRAQLLEIWRQTSRECFFDHGGYQLREGWMATDAFGLLILQRDRQMIVESFGVDFKATVLTERN